MSPPGHAVAFIVLSRCRNYASSLYIKNGLDVERLHAHECTPFQAKATCHRNKQTRATWGMR